MVLNGKALISPDSVMETIQQLLFDRDYEVRIVTLNFISSQIEGKNQSMYFSFFFFFSFLSSESDIHEKKKKKKKLKLGSILLK